MYLIEGILNHKQACALLFVSVCLWGSVMSARQATAAAKTRHGSWQQHPADAVERGRSQFLKKCAFCHGREANGGSAGPNLMRSAVVRHDENGNLIGSVIRDGRPDKGMPAIQLTSDQIMDVVAFLRYRLAESDLRSPKEPGPEYSGAKLLIGKVEDGKAFFYGAGGCSACHSPTSDLKGTARRYPAVELQAHLLYPQDQHLRATVLDSSGKQYAGVIRFLTNYDIAIDDDAGWYHSWPLDAIKLDLKDPLAVHRQLLPKFTDSDMHNILAYLETLK